MRKLLIVFAIAVNIITIYEFAQADSVGPNSPSSASDEGDWQSPWNVYSSDNSRASFNATSQDKLRAYNFSFSITDGSTIDGIKVEVEGYAVDNFLTNEKIRVGLSKSGYTLEGSSKYVDLNCCIEKYEDYESLGGSSDLWGGSWSESDIESSNFGVLIWDYDATASALYIDHVRVTVYYTPPAPGPTSCKVTTWYSEHFDPSGYGSENPNTLDPPKYVTYLHGENSGFSAVSMGDSVDYAWIQIGTTAGDSNFWNSGYLAISRIDSAERCEKILLDSSKTIQDGITYHWRIKFGEDSTSGWSLWSSDQTFEGVAPIEWWDTTYTHRRNIRVDTSGSHDLLYSGYTVPFEMQTGYGEVLFEDGVVNAGIPNAPCMDYYEGYSYISYFGDSTNGQGVLRVGKYNHGTKTWTQATVDTIAGSGDKVDVHNYPVILVGNDEKLHLWRGSHHGQALYYRTDSTHAGNGISITDWSGPDTIAGLDSMTYPVPVMDTSGNLYVFFRHYAHGYHDDAHYCYVKSTDNGATWGDRQHIIYYYDFKDTVDNHVPSVYNGGVVIDGNNRCHILVSWWERYGCTQPDSCNKGRAISYIYSDYDTISNEFKYWRELETGDTVGEITTSPDSTKNVHYESCSKVDTCANPDTIPVQCPCPHSNTYALAVYKHPDSSYYLPYFCYFKFTDYKLEETPIYFAKWNGSSWDITNLETDITPNGPKIWNHKAGGPLIIDGNTIYIYGFAKPSGEEYYGGELVRWRGTELGSNWDWKYFSLNSGKGIGQVVTLPYVPSGQKKRVLYCKAKDIIFTEDYYFPLMRSDGADIKIVQGYYNNNTVYWTEIHRVPSNAFQLDPTELLFPLKYNVLADDIAPINRFYQVYWGKADADPDSILDDPDSVFQYYESFESYDTSSAINGQGGWVTTTGASDTAYVFTSYYSLGSDVWRVWSGDKYLFLDNTVTCSREMGTDVSNVELHCHFFPAENYDRTYMELYDITVDKYIRLGLDLYSDSTYYDLNGNTDTTGLAIRQDQYYDIKMVVNSDSGVAGYVNDVEIFDWCDSIVVFDSLRIYSRLKTVIDGITMTKYVINPPSPALADAIDDISSIRRRSIIKTRSK